jgi:signal peptidase I
MTPLRPLFLQKDLSCCIYQKICYNYHVVDEQTPNNQPAIEEKKPATRKIASGIWELLKIIIIAAIIVIPIRYFVFQPYIVKGDSMVPNFHTGEYLIVDELSYQLHNPGRGDVVVLKYPLDTSQRFIKRVIGLPGETVEIKDGTVAIAKDGKEIALDEKGYLPNLQGTAGTINVTLGKDQYFVLGDNRPFSYDSRGWGILPRKDIIGRAVFRVFPLAAMGYIAEPKYSLNFK